MKCLTDLGADLNVRDEYGSTPLHYAVQQNFIDCVHYLLKKGAKHEIKDVNGRNPLLWAFVEGTAIIYLH